MATSTTDPAGCTTHVVLTKVSDRDSVPPADQVLYRICARSGSGKKKKEYLLALGESDITDDVPAVIGVITELANSDVMAGERAKDAANVYSAASKNQSVQLAVKDRDSFMVGSVFFAVEEATSMHERKMFKISVTQTPSIHSLFTCNVGMIRNRTVRDVAGARGSITTAQFYVNVGALNYANRWSKWTGMNSVDNLVTLFNLMTSNNKNVPYVDSRDDSENTDDDGDKEKIFDSIRFGVGRSDTGARHVGPIATSGNREIFLGSAENVSGARFLILPTTEYLGTIMNALSQGKPLDAIAPAVLTAGVLPGEDVMETLFHISSLDLSGVKTDDLKGIIKATSTEAAFDSFVAGDFKSISGGQDFTATSSEAVAMMSTIVRYFTTLLRPGGTPGVIEHANDRETVTKVVNLWKSFGKDATERQKTNDGMGISTGNVFLLTSKVRDSAGDENPALDVIDNLFSGGMSVDDLLLDTNVDFRGLFLEASNAALHELRRNMMCATVQSDFFKNAFSAPQRARGVLAVEHTKDL